MSVNESVEYRLFIERGDQRGVVLETKDRRLIDAEIANLRGTGTKIWVTTIMYKTVFMQARSAEAESAAESADALPVPMSKEYQ